MGRRLTVVMNSVRVGERIRMLNEVWVNDAWARQTFGPAFLRNILRDQGGQYDVYRLIIPDSAVAYWNGGQNIAMEFRCCLHAPHSLIVGYRGIPVWRGPVVDALEYAYGLAARMEGLDIPWLPNSAQNVLNTLSAYYGEVEGAITIQGTHVAYPCSARIGLDERNYL